MQRLIRLIRTRWGSIGIASFLFLLLACLAVAGSGLRDDRHPADLIVILGNKVRPDGRPSQALQARMDQAVTLYREGYGKLILVSGGHGKEGYDEPVVMRRYLVKAGIPPEMIFEDNAGANTWHTAQNTAIFLGEHHLTSVLIVSQYFHLPRCRLAFEKFGIGPIYTSPARYWSIRDFYSLPREVIGLIGYSLRFSDLPSAGPSAASTSRA